VRHLRRRASRRRRRSRTLTPPSEVEVAVLDVFAENLGLNLTVRQIYYQLVSRRVIANTLSEYSRLDRILVNLRKRRPDVNARIADRTRPLYVGETSFLNDQENYLEVWLEKDALSSVVRQVTDIYGCALQVTRGYASLSILLNFTERVPRGCRPVILYLGDFDPSGEDIFRNIKNVINERFPDAIIEKVAVGKRDIIRYHLASIPVKRTDPRYEKFKEKYGRRGVELDALPPNILLEKIRSAILMHLDVGVRAKSIVDRFVQSSSDSLVDYALQDLRTRLTQVALSRLLDRLDRDKLAIRVMRELEIQKKPELDIPDTLRHTILSEMSNMLMKE